MDGGGFHLTNMARSHSRFHYRPEKLRIRYETGSNDSI